METVDDNHWRKSSYSGNGGGNCVEVGAATIGPRVLVRDTKDRAGGVLTFSPAVWREFAAVLKNTAEA
jgi:hypothetical protein